MVTESSRPGGETEAAQSNSADDLKLASTLSDASDTRYAEDDLRTYFKTVYGASVGRAHMSVGTGPRLKTNGKYDFTDFRGSSFAWPDQADALVDNILRGNAAGDTDIYVCPNLMKGATRTKGDAVARWTVHADVDDDVALDLVRQVGGWAVASGSRGHAQVYVSLTESVPPHWHEALCLGLKVFVGATDSKISDNDLLRPPGSVNHKGPVFGTGPATTAGFLIKPDGSAQDPQELAVFLKVTLPDSNSPSVKRITATPSVNLEELPVTVQDALGEVTGDRSKDIMRIVGACFDSGLALTTTESVVGLREDLAGRLASRTDDDVRRSWLKVVDSRQERSQVSGRARNRPAGTAMTDDEADSTRARFPRLDFAALVAADRPPREWVVCGLIPAGASVSIVAAAGTGKSLLVLAMSMAVTRGDDDFAGYPISRKRRVLLADMENTEDDLADRATALGVSTLGVDSLSELILIHLPQIEGLDTQQGAAQLRAILLAYNIVAGDVVVLDSLQRVIKGHENDSDTMREYYQQTGIMLKRLGITVIRTDNTGKDKARGARGTSGKQDDVDIELILTRDAQDHDRMTLTPGKSRLRDIRVAHLTRSTDGTTGRLQYIGARDPWDDQVADAVTMMNEMELAPDIGEAKAKDALKKANQPMVRSVLRAALKERKRVAESSLVISPFNSAGSPV